MPGIGSRVRNIRRLLRSGEGREEVGKDGERKVEDDVIRGLEMGLELVRELLASRAGEGADGHGAGSFHELNRLDELIVAMEKSGKKWGISERAVEGIHWLAMLENNLRKGFGKRGIGMEEAKKAYVVMINSIIGMGYNVSPEEHGLCEICMTDFAGRKRRLWNGKIEARICSICKKRMDIMLRYNKRLTNDILKRIYEIRCALNHEIMAGVYKYLSPEGKKLYEYIMGGFQSIVDDSKKHEEIRKKYELPIPDPDIDPILDKM